MPSPARDMTRDMNAKWFSLDGACCAPGWSVRKISDWIEDGRLPWSGYSQARRKDVTSDKFPRNFTIARIDLGNRMHIVRLDPRRDDTIEGVKVLLPTSPPVNSKASPPVQRWRKPPPDAALKLAALAVADTYQPDDPPTADEWAEALNKELGKPVTRKIARGALTRWAPQLQRQRGQKRNRRK